MAVSMRSSRAEGRDGGKRRQAPARPPTLNATKNPTAISRNRWRRQLDVVAGREAIHGWHRIVGVLPNQPPIDRPQSSRMRTAPAAQTSVKLRWA